jgi:hypothetical protein
LPSTKELVEAALPQGRIGRALVRFAAALPNASASFELLKKTMAIKFGDGLDSYRIAPKSRELAVLVRRHGPDAAGDKLLAEYRRLSTERARIVTAFRSGLPVARCRVQDEGAKLHFGRESREGTVDLGKGLTEALRSGSALDAIRSSLPAHPDLAESVIEALPTDAPAILPGPVKEVLAPPRPAPVLLPANSKLDLDGLDRMAKTLIGEWFAEREVLDAYFDPLQFDRQSDTWASRKDWLAAARRFRVEEFREARVELLVLDLGKSDHKAGWLNWLRHLGWHGENEGAEIAAVYRYRHEIPDVAREWLAPKPFKDCPDAQWRAREGDWIASRHLAASVDSQEIEPWGILWKLLPSAAAVFFEQSRLENWRALAVREINEKWDWSFADEDLLKASVVHGWREVGEAIERNDYLVHALLHDDHALMLAGGSILLAWARLLPSLRLAQLVGLLFGQDLRGRAVAPAWRIVGPNSQNYEEMACGIADCWTAKLRRHLAVAWTRCRPFVF